MAMDVISKYIKKGIKAGATDGRQIFPGVVVTAPWVRLKCQFGCPAYGQGYCCPPDTPDHHQTRAVLDSYQRAILFQLEPPLVEKRSVLFRKYHNMLVKMEGDLFKEGYYKAFVYLSGPCRLCKECKKMSDEPCNNGYKARPSMESCGIDVFQTARNCGYPIDTLSKREEVKRSYCLMLID